MDSEERELAQIARPLPGKGDDATMPLENPGRDVETDDPLLIPRSDEPGVMGNGDCYPIENPGRSGSAAEDGSD